MDLVIGQVKVRPGNETVWDEAFRTRVRDGAGQPGWMGVMVCAPFDDPSERVIIGRWRHRADYEAWTRTDGFQASQDLMAEWQDRGPETRWHRTTIDAGFDIESDGLT